MVEALEALWTAPGVVQSVLSGNIRPNARAKLAAFGLDTLLDLDVGAYGSDDARRSNLVAIAQGRASVRYATEFTEKSTVLVGDTPRDVRAGIDGGARVVAVATGVDSVESLSYAGANVVLSSLADTAEVLAAIGLSRCAGSFRPSST